MTIFEAKLLMIDHIVQFDKHLFHFINHDMGNAFFDWLMPILREPKTWIPLYLFIIIFSVYRFKKAGFYIIAVLIITFAISDSGSAGLGKHLFKRVRPCNDPAMAASITVRIPCGTGYSFPSAHATNHFAIAACLCFIFYKRWRWIWLWATLWAASICFAQVYVGVHYPVDVTVGALFGFLIGWLTSLLFRKVQPNF